MNLPFFSMHKAEIASHFVTLGEKPFRAAQLLDWVYQKKVVDAALMSSFSKEQRALISEKFNMEQLKLSKKEMSTDQQTDKYLWELSDGKLVESVLICAPDRRTVCVSSQVGCNARCAFCASGKQGLMRNLTTAEIVEQVYKIDQELSLKGERVSHVVFMGMGEPLDNYENVIAAVKILLDPECLGLSQRRITISTVGVVEGIERFTKEQLKVNLVLSLHAPNQHIRKKIIPYARKYPLEDVLTAMENFGKMSGRDTTYEYILIDGINDSVENAEELAVLLKYAQCTVNLIPYNPVDGLHLKRPSRESVAQFMQVLQNRKINATQRYTKGKDIAAACGQLALKTREETALLQLV